jgi:hypothetical protein
MINILDYIFNYSLFLTRNHCGPGWTQTLALRSQMADFLIGLSYTSIPITLIFFYYRSKARLPKTHVLVLFALFIILCGGTHFNDIMVFHYPMYRFFVIIKELTAIASLPTAVLLPAIVMDLLKLPSFEDLRKLNTQLEQETILREKSEASCLEQNRLMTIKINQLEQELRASNWIAAKSQTLKEIKLLLVSSTTSGTND